MHWHITDSQSFPIQLEKYPESTAKMAPAGSYHQSRRYSVDDAKEIVEYANFRGNIQFARFLIREPLLFSHQIKKCYVYPKPNPNNVFGLRY